MDLLHLTLPLILLGSCWGNPGHSNSSLLLTDHLLEVDPPGPFDFSLSEGGSLTCLVPDDLLAVTVKWLVWGDDQPVTVVPGLREVDGRQLVFPAAADKLYRADLHHQHYVCLATTANWTASSPVVTVTAEVLPRWVEKPEEHIRLEVGETLTLPCRATGEPTSNSTVSWYIFEGGSRKPVPEASMWPCRGGVLARSDGTLVIHRVQRSHGGYFVCRAENRGGGGVEAVVLLDVTAAPRVAAQQPLVSALEGSRADLECLVEGSAATVLWQKAGGGTIDATLDPKYSLLQVPQGHGALLSRLQVVGVVPQDAGLYTCTAASVWGRGTAGVELVVQDTPLYSGVPKYGVQTPHEDNLGQVLRTIDKWGIDIFRVAELTHWRPLTVVTFAAFRRRGLLATFSIAPQRLATFLAALEVRYRPVPFHNSTHAADILQSTHVLLNSPTIKGMFTDLEILATLFAAAIHDVDHPGTTDQCLQQSSSIPPIHNETVLEEHHLTVGFQLLENEEMDFLSSLSVEDRQTFKELVQTIVLSTNLKNHTSHIEFLKGKIEWNACPSLWSETPEDKNKLLSAIVHLADLSSATKPFTVYARWVRAIMEEFFRQGDQEKQLGSPVAQICDRQLANIDHSQTEFLDYIVLPLWRLWAEIDPHVGYMLRILQGNRDLYRNQAAVHTSP